jgi:hypothetical protein
MCDINEMASLTKIIPRNEYGMVTHYALTTHYFVVPKMQIQLLLMGTFRSASLLVMRLSTSPPMANLSASTLVMHLSASPPKTHLSSSLLVMHLSASPAMTHLPASPTMTHLSASLLDKHLSASHLVLHILGQYLSKKKLCPYSVVFVGPCINPTWTPVTFAGSIRVTRLFSSFSECFG